jgi:hypothetical protein
MGMSGFKGKAYILDDYPADLDATSFPSGGDVVDLADEITKYTIDQSVQSRKYGHDKSGGWQDSCAGIRSMSITIDAVVRSGGMLGARMAGTVVFLELYEYGVDDTSAPWRGYALVDTISETVSQEDGAAVSYTATLSSKGAWTGVTAAEWGGFENL